MQEPSQSQNQSPADRMRAIHADNHPFPFLLYLEWGLVAIAILGELLPSPIRPEPRFSILTIASVASFGLMGLWLPTRPTLVKMGFILLQIGLIVLATLAGMRGLRLFPFLYLVLVIRGCLMFRTSGQLIIASTAFTLFLLMIIQRVHHSPFRIPPGDQERIRPVITGFAVNSTLLFALAIGFVMLLVNALLAERQSREKLAIANDQLREYALRIEDLAMAQERSRIAREIHDTLGHSLTALNLQLEGALKLWETDPSRSRTFLQDAKRMGSTALQDVRRSVATLRSDPLQGRSLAEAIALLGKETQRTTGIRPDMQIHLRHPLSTEIQTTLYRITQEALTNIRKHAHASEVTIQLHTLPNQVHLTIRDNGQGFHPSQNQTGFGLQGMQERALALHGHLSINSQPRQGCLIQVQIPLI